MAGEACPYRKLDSDVLMVQPAKHWLSFDTPVTLDDPSLGQNKRTEARNVLSSIYRCISEGFYTRDLKEAKGVLDALA